MTEKGTDNNPEVLGMWLCCFNTAGQNGGTFDMFCEEVIGLRGCYPARPLASEDNIPPPPP